MRDHAPLLLLLLLLLLPVLLFPGAIPGPRVVSADDHLTVHHAFQTTAGGGTVHHPLLSDPALLLSALRKRTVEALRAGEAPLWNPDIYAGAPLLADGQSMVGSPVTWLRLVLPEDAAQDAGVWWILVWCGLGTALLARRLRAGPWGAGIAGAAAMLGPFPVVWLLHPVAATFCWLPWLLLGVESGHAAGVALAVAGLLGGGHPATAVHALLIAMVWWIVRSRRGAVVLGLLVGVALAAPLWLPLIEQAARSETLTARGGNHLSPALLLDLLWPGWWGHPALGGFTGPGEWSDGQLHPGLAVLALALLGWRQRPVAGLWLGWGAAVLLAMIGLPGPLNHARLASLAAWLLALAAGLVVGRWPRRRAALALVAVVATGLWARQHDQHTLPPALHDPRPAPWTVALRQVLDCETEAGDCGRVLGLSWALQPNTGALAGLRDLRGYDLPVSADTRRLMAALRPQPIAPWFPVETAPSAGLLRFAAVRVLLVEHGQPVPGEPLDLGPAPLTAAAVDLDAPRAWLAHAAVPIGSAADALRVISRSPDARGRPPVEGLRAPVGGAPGVTPLRPQEEGTGQVRIDLSSVGSGLVVLADAWAPGWQVAVDGAPAACLRVGGYFRGVLATAGAQEAVFTYRPAGWRWGLRLGAVGLLGLLGLLYSGRCWARRRR